MSRSDPQVNFRIPSELKLKLEEASSRNRRSITAELIARLEWSFSDEESLLASLESGPPQDDDMDVGFDLLATPVHGVRVRGVSKELLLKSLEGAEGDKPVTRAELWSALDYALGKIGVTPVQPPNTGPKPRKRFSKE